MLDLQPHVAVPDAGNGRPSVAASPGWSRRSFLRLSGATVAAAALAGCGLSRGSSVPRAREKVQLVYQDWRTDWFPPMAQRLLEEFHATHPNIRVYYTLDPDNLDEKMQTDFATGHAPDVFQGCCHFFPVWAQKGYLLDLRPYVEADLDQATLSDWDPAQYQAFFTRDGRQYGLPKYHGALALYYNKDTFDRYRVGYPEAGWSHDDYLAAMKRLTHDRDGDGKTDLWGSMFDVSWERIQVHVNAWGGHFVDPRNPARCLMGEAAAMAAMGWLRERMWGDKCMATSLDVQNLGTREAFVSGRLAMVEDGSWALKGILSSANFRFGLAPLPAGPQGRATLATTDGFAIYAGTKHPDAAWELMQFLISKDYGRAMARAHFLQPARASLVEEWVRTIRDEYPAQTQDLDIAAFADGHLKGYSVIAETFANMAEAQRLAAAAWQRIYTLGQAQLETMVETCRSIQDAQPGAGREERRAATHPSL